MLLKVKTMFNFFNSKKQPEDQSTITVTINLSERLIIAVLTALVSSGFFISYQTTKNPHHNIINSPTKESISSLAE